MVEKFKVITQDFVQKIVKFKKIIFAFFCLASVLVLAVPAGLVVKAVQNYFASEVPERASIPIIDLQPTVVSPEQIEGGVVFRVFAPTATRVFLGGDFNNYDASRHPMTKKQKGIWEIMVPLKSGWYTYKFKVDGKWMVDPNNSERTPPPKQSSVVMVP